jgi:phosphoesterase RecJ-like protein
MSAKEILANIKNSRSIAVLPHVNMDCDACGSSLAFYLALKSMGKEVVVIVEEEPQEIFSFLPNFGEIYLFNGENQCIENKAFDLVLALDTGDFERLGKRGKIFENAKMSINIDHHPTNTNYAKTNYVVTNASATGEIIYDLFKELKLDITASISTCLYASIASDTGGFRFSNTTSHTHNIAAELINMGVNSAHICSNLFENNSIERLQIMGEIINRIETYESGKISLITLPQSIINKYRASEEDISGFSNMGRTIRGVEVSIFIRERSSSLVKVSMRSRDKIDLTLVASKYGGGGHRRAAGFEYNGTIAQCKELLLKEFSELI